MSSEYSRATTRVRARFEAARVETRESSLDFFVPASGSGPAFAALDFDPASGSGPAFTALGFGLASGSRPASSSRPASGFGPAFTALGFDLTSASGPAFTFGFRPCIGLRPYFWASAPHRASVLHLLLLGLGPTFTAFGPRPSIYCFWAPAPHLLLSGTRRSRAKSDVRVHTSSRTHIGSFFLYFSREGPDKECNRLNRQTNMPIGLESTPLRRTTDAGATGTIGDDDCTRRPPRVTLTMKIGAFAFIIHIETTSNIIRPSKRRTLGHPWLKLATARPWQATYTGASLVKVRPEVTIMRMEPQGASSPLTDSCLPHAIGRALKAPEVVKGCATPSKPTMFREEQTIRDHHQSPRVRRSILVTLGSILVIQVHPGHSGPSWSHSGPSRSFRSFRSFGSFRSKFQSLRSFRSFGLIRPNFHTFGSIRSKFRSLGSVRSKFRSFGSFRSKSRSILVHAFGSIPATFRSVLVHAFGSISVTFRSILVHAFGSILVHAFGSISVTFRSILVHAFGSIPVRTRI
ncbi:hypothetical protein CRG98_009161 [Punica granatum]|uniref:Uncharacterized protein n=1 Tax=Punica granatum TaxID=22663 RepID=A0A2I0KPN8_PUNGR|nr:hypothetical protein CRG98_009161 [Punica granatum]